MFGIFGKKEKVKLDNEEIIFEGFLTKKGEKVQNWKKRYFVLTENYISYYPTEKKKSNLGFIKLEGSTLGYSNEKKSCFTVITPERTFLLSAETDLLMNCWVEKISEVLGLEIKPQNNSNGSGVGSISSPKNTNIRKSIGLEDKNGSLKEKQDSDKSIETISQIVQNSPELKTDSKKNTTPSLETLQTTSTKNLPSVSLETNEQQQQQQQQTTDGDNTVQVRKDSGGKRKLTKTNLTPADEYSIFQSALHIFLKEEDDRTTEEKCYVLALYQYYEKLQTHMFETGSKPEFSLASGTYILCKEEELRTEEEQEFLNLMIENYFESLPPEIIPFDVQIDGVLRAKEIFQKPNHTRTKDEKNFVKNLTRFRKDIINIQRKYGLKPENSILSSIISLSKYEDERTQEDLEFLKEIENLKETK